jgi:hypothetical protein
MRRLIWSLALAPVVALMAGCAPTPADVATAGPNTPGWTGRTIVVGTSSTTAGDAEATYLSQKWGIGRRN